MMLGFKTLMGAGACRLAAASSLALSCLTLPAGAQEADWSPCTEDAMIVFDASGSMSSDSLEATAENTALSRIDLVRDALAQVLPSVTRFRRVGLMTYGPTETDSLFNQCENIVLNHSPTPNAAQPIMKSVQALVPTGGTPLTKAVQDSAVVLDFEHKPGVIVLLTDGQDTCGGLPCSAGKSLHAEAAQLTIHVIGLGANVSTQNDEDHFASVQCLAAQNGGLYLAPKTTEDLVAALETTLGCPKVSGLRHNARSHTPAAGALTQLPGSRTASSLR